MSFALFVEQLLNGAQFGLMLFLIASGLTLVLSIMNTLNLTHGALYMLGAFCGVAAYGHTGSFLLSALIAIAGVVVIAAALEYLVMRHLYERDHLDQVLATFGALLFITEAVTIIWGRAPLHMELPSWLRGALQITPDFQYPIYRLVVAGVGVALALSMYMVIQHTRIGIEVRAGAADRVMLSCCGVNVQRLFLFVFCAGAALAGLAGLMVGPLVSVDAHMGDTILSLCFVVIAIGGLGSVRGALVAAIAVGWVEAFGRTLFPPMFGYPLGPALASVCVYAFMALVLIVRPRGLFPARA